MSGWNFTAILLWQDLIGILIVTILVRRLREHSLLMLGWPVAIGCVFLFLLIVDIQDATHYRITGIVGDWPIRGAIWRGILCLWLLVILAVEHISISRRIDFLKRTYRYYQLRKRNRKMANQ